MVQILFKFIHTFPIDNPLRQPVPFVTNSISKTTSFLYNFKLCPLVVRPRGGKILQIEAPHAPVPKIWRPCTWNEIVQYDVVILYYFFPGAQTSQQTKLCLLGSVNPLTLMSATVISLLAI